MLKKYDTRLIPLTKNKTIYFLENDKSVIAKAFTDISAMRKEHAIHTKAHLIVPCPYIVDCFQEDSTGYLLLKRINGKSVYDLYGCDINNVPKAIWKQIHTIVYKLFYHNIHYIDITPYNFMVEDTTEKVYVIDFGDAYECNVNWFLKDFLDGETAWNADFE